MDQPEPTTPPHVSAPRARGPPRNPDATGPDFQAAGYGPASDPRQQQARPDSGAEDDEDEDDHDRDSALGTEFFPGSTMSMASSILEYRRIYGRTYHRLRGNADYWSPNDQLQNDSLDATHHAFTMMMDNKLFLAPIPDDVQRVLDIGTGTGIWAIDFADQYPSAQVTGTDISPIQPVWVPPNVRFQIDDFSTPWTWPPGSIDFVHGRCLFGSVPDWPFLFSEAFRVLRPGGWFESFEQSCVVKSADGSIRPWRPVEPEPEPEPEQTGADTPRAGTGSGSASASASGPGRGSASRPGSRTAVGPEFFVPASALDAGADANDPSAPASSHSHSHSHSTHPDADLDKFLSAWGKIFDIGGQRTGRSFTIVDEGLPPRWMREAGFVDVRERRFECPLWGYSDDARLREVGHWNAVASSEGLEGYALYIMTTVLGWTKAEHDAFMGKMRRALSSKRFRGYFEVSVVYGRKPPGPTASPT